MAVPYNMTALQNSTNIASQLIAVNDLTSNALGLVTVIIITVIFYIKFSDTGPIEAFTAASFIGSVFALLFSMLNLLTLTVFLFFICMTAGGVVMLWTRGK